MTIKLNDGLDFPDAEEAKQDVLDQLDGQQARILMSARRIAKECARVLIAYSVNHGGWTVWGFTIREAFCGVNYRGTAVLVNKETVSAAAGMLQQAGYVVFRTGTRGMRGAPMTGDEMLRYWSDLSVRFPTKRESPGEGAST